MSGWDGNSSGWTNIGAAGGPAFQNSWVNFGSTFQVAGFQLVGRTVRLRGLVKSGAVNTTIFTLPTGYRPAADELFPVESTGQVVVRLDVKSDGTVGTFSMAGATTYVSLAGVAFDIG